MSIDGKEVISGISSKIKNLSTSANLTNSKNLNLTKSDMS